MNCRSIPISAIAFSVLLSTSTIAEPVDQQPDADVVTIPLDQVWAYEMPGTRDIRELDRANIKLLGKALLDPISVSLLESPNRPKPGESAGKGFAVTGTDRVALQRIYAILVGGEKPHSTFSTDDEVTAVFFSYPFAGRYIHIGQIERLKGEFKISYRGQPYSERHFSFALALVPLGRLTEGQYQVTMIQLPLEEKYIKRGFRPREKQWSERFVCGPFSFHIVNDGATAE
jgi:hypothetical protein